MCFDAFYLSVHEACGHAKQPPVRLGWLNCLNFPCSLRLHAEDPATYNFDLRAWRRAKQLPPLGTPAQTIRFPEPGLCRICREWAGMHAKVGLDEVPALPMHIVKGMGYPIDMESKPATKAEASGADDGRVGGEGAYVQRVGDGEVEDKGGGDGKQEAEPDDEDDKSAFMSSTYVHYGAPSSLPSDYALLSRYAAAHDVNPESDNEDEDDHHTMVGSSTHPDDDLLSPNAVPIGRRTPIRRSSFPTLYVTPFNPVTGPLPDRSGYRSGPNANPSENTPLLGPLVPRIEEDVDKNDDSHEPAVNMLLEEIRILGKYTLPVFGTHVLEYSLVVASVVSIGHLSTTALAASTLGSMTASVSGFSIIQGFASTLDTMLPSAWTSSQPHLVGLWSQRMAVVMSVTLIPIIFIWLKSESILLALKQDPEVAHLAAVYLQYSIIGLPAYAFNSISRRYFQSQGLFTVPTRVILCVAPINAVLNYILVWGPDSVRLGFIGAPIATAISFNLISIASIIYGVFYVPKTAWHPISRRMFTSLGVLVQLGLAGVGQTASEWWSWELVGLAASLLGPVALACQSVLLVSASTTFQAPFALSVATSVRIGNLLGEQNGVRAGFTAKASLLIGVAVALLWSSMFMIFRKQWAHIFNDDPEVVEMVASILPIVSLFQVFDGLSAVTGGILRAMGKQFTGALLNLSAYYVIGIPFGIWLAFERDMALHGLWIGLTISLVYAAAIGVWICLRTDWEREVKKVQDRLEVDRKANQGAKQCDVEVGGH
ncbi:hypothetical protein EUX98_g2769 [Antrodiella citrinella]|uniref:MATE efflux family protein n=1 Tax=Antrodiella citrinella TaxID=2447956 RepID=A0A4V3XJ24_9APHY|nr:hypothetical protein EUX98_g2769 [Antrodiella citrinella]